MALLQCLAIHQAFKLAEITAKDAIVWAECRVPFGVTKQTTLHGGENCLALAVWSCLPDSRCVLVNS